MMPKELKQQMELAAETADPSVISTLAKDPGLSPKVKEALAGNPNVPWSTLRGFLESHPRAVVENPVLPLLLMENPGLFVNLSPYELAGLASCFKRVSELFSWSDNDSWSELRLTLYCMAKTPQKNIQGINMESYRELMARWGLFSETVQLTILEHERSDRVLRTLAKGTQSPMILEFLIEDPELHQIIMRNSALPSYLSEELAARYTGSYLGNLLTNENLTEKALLTLARSSSVGARNQVAQRVKNHPKIREELSFDSSPRVRHHISQL